jgi:shikimate kinase
LKSITASEVFTVVSLGGGAVLRPENRRIIQSSGYTAWLQASPELLAARIASDQTTADRRPALTSLAAQDEITKLLTMREPLYREVADIAISTNNRSLDAVAEEIAHWYQTMLASRNDGDRAE